MCYVSIYKLYMQVEGHHIRVDQACPPRKKLKGDNTTLYDHKRTVFVGNLPFDAKVVSARYGFLFFLCIACQFVFINL